MAKVLPSCDPRKNFRESFFHYLLSSAGLFLSPLPRFFLPLKCCATLIKGSIRGIFTEEICGDLSKEMPKHLSEVSVCAVLDESFASRFFPKRRVPLA